MRADEVGFCWRPGNEGGNLKGYAMIIQRIGLCLLVSLAFIGMNCKSQASTATPKGGTTAAGPTTEPATLMDQTKLPDLKGDTKSLAEYKQAKGLVLMFTDTRCPHGATAIKDMPTVAKVLTGQQIATVVVNTGDAKDAVTAYYAKNNAGTAVVYDTTIKTLDAWNVQSVPTVAYVTPDGKIGYFGPATWPAMATAIEKSLGLAAGTIKFTSQGTGGG